MSRQETEAGGCDEGDQKEGAVCFHMNTDHPLFLYPVIPSHQAPCPTATFNGTIHVRNGEPRRHNEARIRDDGNHTRRPYSNSKGSHWVPRNHTNPRNSLNHNIRHTTGTRRSRLRLALPRQLLRREAFSSGTSCQGPLFLLFLRVYKRFNRDRVYRRLPIERSQGIRAVCHHENGHRPGGCGVAR